MSTTNTIPEELKDTVTLSSLDYAIEFLIVEQSGFTKFPMNETKNDLVIAVNGGLKQKARENKSKRPSA